jgi:hypothetical protein
VDVEFFVTDSARYGVTKPLARLPEEYRLLEEVLAVEGGEPGSWVCTSLPIGLADVVAGRVSTFADGLNAYSVVADNQVAVIQCDGRPQIEECRLPTREFLDLLTRWTAFVKAHHTS